MKGWLKRSISWLHCSELNPTLPAAHCLHVLFTVQTAARTGGLRAISVFHNTKEAITIHLTLIGKCIIQASQQKFNQYGGREENKWYGNGTDMWMSRVSAGCHFWSSALPSHISKPSSPMHVQRHEELNTPYSWRWTCTGLWFWTLPY